jgi:hypothetical protein
MPYPSYPPWFDHPNNNWWSIQVMKLLMIHVYKTMAVHLLCHWQCGCHEVGDWGMG